MSGTLRLDDASVEAIARRVVELMDGGQGSKDWIDAAEVARRLNVSRDYVYEHANDLDAVRIGSGPRARLRFEAAKVAARLRCSGSDTSHDQVTAVRPVRSERDAPLLPIRGESL